MSIMLFQSSLPRGERPHPSGTYTSMMHFNPRSHEGSDTTPQDEDEEQVISILAPTRGATFDVRCIPVCLSISILAPTRGATILSKKSSSDSTFQSSLPRGERRMTAHALTRQVNFNPRSHEGSDWQGFTAEYNPIISILAPTRGATFLG